MAVIDLSSIPKYRPVLGFPDYFVSIDGRVFSKFQSGRPRKHKDGKQVRQRLPKGKVYEIALASHPFGYPTVCLYGPKKTRMWATVHRLLLEAFDRPRPDKMQCRHLDGDVKNCHFDNLCWGTCLENAADKKRHGTQEQGVSHHAAKLTVKDIHEIRRLVSAGTMRKDISQTFGISISCISAIVTKRNWSHVQDLLNSG